MRRLNREQKSSLTIPFVMHCMQVTKNKKWRDVSSTLGLGPSSSAGFTLKKNYGKHLFPFECRYDRGNIDPAPLLAFLEQPSKKESKKAAAERAAAAAGDYLWSLFLKMLYHVCQTLFLRFNGHFPGEPGLADRVYWSKGWWSWWVVTTGLLEL